MVQHVDLTGRPTNCKSRRRYNGTTPGNRRQHATTLGAYGMLHCARHMPVHAELEEQVPEDVRRTVDFPPAVGRPAYFHVLCLHVIFVYYIAVHMCMYFTTFHVCLLCPGPLALTCWSFHKAPATSRHVRAPPRSGQQHASLGPLPRWTDHAEEDHHKKAGEQKIRGGTEATCHHGNTIAFMLPRWRKSQQDGPRRRPRLRTHEGRHCFGSTPDRQCTGIKGKKRAE
jgi:hypothetical protein